MHVHRLDPAAGQATQIRCCQSFAALNQDIVLAAFFVSCTDPALVGNALIQVQDAVIDGDHLAGATVGAR